MENETFELNGFSCTVTERPDLCYLRKVHGYRKSDDMHFLPTVLFEQDCSLEDIREVCASRLDGTFNGRVETYGRLNGYV